MSRLTAFAVVVLFAQSAAPQPFRPPLIRDGAATGDVSAAISTQCAPRARRIHPPFIVLRSHVRHEQVQIDCDGFVFEGRARHAEFVFVDDSLEMAWIMTTADEEEALLRALTAAYGPADRRNSKFIAFTKARAALRLDIPEVLFYSARIAPQIEGWFATPSTFR